jgi:hypothetical protein
MRDVNGQSIVAAIVAGGHWKFLTLLFEIPAFDPEKCDASELLAAVCRMRTLNEGDLEELSVFPQIDINAPLPHGVGGFPDSSDRKRIAGQRRPSEGLPLMFSRDVPVDHDAFPLDLERRGKHGESVLARRHWSGARLPGSDDNATDRHGNTAAIADVMSRRFVAGGRQREAGLRRRNENGETDREIANARARRRPPGVERRRLI